MKTSALIAALFVVSCMSLGAQVETKKATSETVYLVQISGISAWSAAAMAKKASLALNKMDNVENAVVDTTARGVIKMKNGKAPTVDAINKALGGGRLKTKAVTKSSHAKAHEIYTISVKGLAWQGTAKSIRAMLEKKDGVIAAYPHGDSHLVHIRAKKTGVFTKSSITDLIQKDRRFKVTSFKTKVLTKKKSKPVSKM